MRDSEQVANLVSELQKVIKRFTLEYDLTNAAVVGSLEMVKLRFLSDQETLDYEESVDDIEEDDSSIY